MVSNQRPRNLGRRLKQNSSVSQALAVSMAILGPDTDCPAFTLAVGEVDIFQRWFKTMDRHLSFDRQNVPDCVKEPQYHNRFAEPSDAASDRYP
jgi:hypothetical protein